MSMRPQEFKTAEEILAISRRRLPVCPSGADERATSSGVLIAFEDVMSERHDLGIANRLLNLLLECSNPFEPSKTRRPKMETIIFGTLILLVVAAAVFFNLLAPRVQVIP